jgi:hypothetical protein
VSRSSKWSLPFTLCNQNFTHISHHPWFDYPKNIKWRVQNMECIMHLSWTSRHILHSGSKYFPKHSVLEHPQHVLPLMWQTKLYTHRSNNSFVNFKVYVFRYQTGRKTQSQYYQTWKKALIEYPHNWAQFMINLYWTPNHWTPACQVKPTAVKQHLHYYS